MKLAVLQFELLIGHAESLKDKRRVVKSLKDRLHREHMVAVAEVGALDERGAARLAAVAVGTDVKHLQSLLAHLVEKLRALPDARLGAVSGRVIDGPDVDEDGLLDLDSVLSPAERIAMLAAGTHAARALQEGA